MKINHVCAVLFCVGLCVLTSCTQGPIFYIVSKETAPVEPLIKGAPTKMVTVTWKGAEVLCAASDRLYWYRDGRWDASEYAMPQPGGKIIDLTATANRLYALCMHGSNLDFRLKYLDLSNDEAAWVHINSPAGDYTVLQSIYADPETYRLFAGARKNDSNSATYAMLYLDTTDTLKLLRDEVGIFSGVVCRDGIYYLCTRRGIWRITEADLVSNTVTTITQLADFSTNAENNRTFMGIIKLEDPDSTIIVVERDGGALYTVDDTTFTRMYYAGSETGITTGRYATGALGLWTDLTYVADDDPTNDKNLLVAGIQGGLYNTTTSSYTHGYVEFELNADGSFNDEVGRHDSGSLQSIRDNDRYTSSIGKYPINHLFQAPLEIDENMTFFAATQAKGLWSYKDRPADGGWQWNAED